MTDTWAAKVLAGVPRFDHCDDGYEARDRGAWVTYGAALAAIARMGREMALDVLASSGQAQEAYAAQLDAEAERDALRAKVARLEGAIDYILDGMAISAPEYAIDPDDDFLDAANADWVRDTLSRLAAALTDGGKDG